MDQWSDCLRDSKPQLEDTGSSLSSSGSAPGPSQSETAEPEGYIKGAMMKEFIEFPNNIFHTSKDLPTLRRDVVNNILTYRESFNPPHVGHKTVSSHCFLRSSFENTIAAIIVPQDVDEIMEKTERAKEPEGSAAMVLSRAQRGELWRDDTLMQWAWVYTCPQRFKLWREKLLGLVNDAGFKLEFVVLAGRETAPSFIAGKVKSGKPLPNLILSNPMRTIDTFHADKTPKLEPGYGEWETNARGEEQLVDKIERGYVGASDTLSLLYPRQTQLVEGLLVSDEGLVEPNVHRLQHLLQLSGSSVVCTANGFRRTRVQYVPARNVTCANYLPSSTLVRRLFRETAPEGRLERIAEIALNA